jgi:hypothetical protein
MELRRKRNGITEDLVVSESSPAARAPRHPVFPTVELRGPCAAIFTIERPTRITIATVRRLTLPSLCSRDLNSASRMASTSAATQQFAVNGLVVCNSFSAAFTLKHRERKQASARRHGGLLLRRSAPTGSWFLPLRRSLQESRPWHLGAVSRSRPPGGVP